MRHLFRFWEAFRDPENGAYCDMNSFGTVEVCDGSMMYSSAGTGMGLIAECVFAELSLLGKEQARANVLQTLTTVQRDWPRERHHGFFGHFVKREGGKLVNLAEYSTVDTAELMMGALFAGNYFGGAVQGLAASLAAGVRWSDAIDAADQPQIRPVADPDTGALTGIIMPFNEYYILAYIAKLHDPCPKSKASQYFETYHSSHGAPAGRSDGHPVPKNYRGRPILSDQPFEFLSSFIPQFCWFQTRSFQSNSYYRNMLREWLLADIAFWDNITRSDSLIWGQPVKGKIFGCGAGPGHDEAYTVNRIDGSEEPIFSAAIMAGFLAVKDAALRKDINERLQWLMDNGVCTYRKTLPDGYTAIVPWRCSLRYPDWRAPGADSIDFSTMVLGYALNFLPADFYHMYAA